MLGCPTRDIFLTAVRLAGIIACASGTCSATRGDTMPVRSGLLSGLVCFADTAAAARAAGKVMTSGVRKGGNAAACAVGQAWGGRLPAKGNRGPAAMLAHAGPEAGRSFGGRSWGIEGMFGGSKFGSSLMRGLIGGWHQCLMGRGHGAMHEARSSVGRPGGATRQRTARRASSLQFGDEEDAKGVDAPATASPKVKRARSSKASEEKEARTVSEDPAKVMKPRVVKAAHPAGDVEEGSVVPKVEAVAGKRTAEAPKARKAVTKSTVFPLPEAGEAAEAAKAEPKRKAVSRAGRKSAATLAAEGARSLDWVKPEPIADASAAPDADGAGKVAKVVGTRQTSASGLAEADKGKAVGAAAAAAKASRPSGHDVLYVAIDGASRGNPGSASFGVSITDGADKKVYQIARNIG